MKLRTASRIRELVSSKRFMIIFAAVLLVAGGGLYSWWSIASWNGLQARYSVLKQDTEKRFNTALDMKADTKEQRTEKLAVLEDMLKRLPTDDVLCQMNGAINWQRMLGDLQKREEECQKVQSSVAAFRTPLEKTVTYLKYEHELAGLMAAAPAGGETSEGDWAGRLESWKALTKMITDMKSGGGFDVVKQTAVGSSSSIVAAWEEVLASHQAKDKARYAKAASTLASAYDSLQTITKADTDGLQAILASLKESYQKLSE